MHMNPYITELRTSVPMFRLPTLSTSSFYEPSASSFLLRYFIFYMTRFLVEIGSDGANGAILPPLLQTLSLPSSMGRVYTSVNLNGGVLPRLSPIVRCPDSMAHHGIAG